MTVLFVRENQIYFNSTLITWSIILSQLCPTCRLRAACGPGESLCAPIQVFAVVKVSYTLTTFPYFDNLEFDIFDAGGLLSATLSHLLTLQLGFDRFQCIGFS